MVDATALGSLPMNSDTALNAREAADALVVRRNVAVAVIPRAMGAHRRTAWFIMATISPVCGGVSSQAHTRGCYGYAEQQRPSAEPRCRATVGSLPPLPRPIQHNQRYQRYISRSKAYLLPDSFEGGPGGCSSASVCGGEGSQK